MNRRGSLGNSIHVSGIKVLSNIELSINYTHEKYGSGTWVLDKNTLEVKWETQGNANLEQNISRLPVNEPITRHSKTDNTGKYIIEWNTLPSNQDLPRKPPYPEPSELIWKEIQK